MIRTDEYIWSLSCPKCGKKKLYIWSSNGGEGNSEVIIKCKQCNTYITTNLIPNMEDWKVETKYDKGGRKIKGGKIWNQA